ncbi:Alpha/Beta hydrolase protein [Mycena vulgaris]|nr:Alpha/Beta hydrolase protein [Mycena vulgaris]
MNIESFILDSPPAANGKELRMAAKRYTSAGKTPSDSDGVTLLMFHAMGQHKEQWEPTLEKLYTLKSPIREVWVFDWQSHGESAVLNEEALEGDKKAAPLDRWALAIAAFIKSDFVKGHRLVGVGHSSGTVGLMVSTRHFEQCPYAGIILVEPSMMDQQIWEANREEIQPAFDMVTNAVMHRRDGWTSKEAAHKYFMARFPWNTWDPRIVVLFTEYGLKDSIDEDGKPCVIRKCPMIHEASAFQVNLEITWDAAAQVAKLSGVVPIHVIFGENVDMMPQVIRDGVIDKTKGRIVDSVTTIPDVGHTIVQELPDVVGSTISQLLDVILTIPSELRSHM